MAHECQPYVHFEARLGRLELVVQGAIQSISVEGPGLVRGYWPAMLPEERPGSALLLGLGGGTVAHLIHRRFGPVPIVGVENNPEVLELGRQHFGLDRLPGLRIVVQDAFSFVAACPDRFDYVAVDLSQDGRVLREVTRTTFWRRLHRLLTPEGRVVLNLTRMLPHDPLVAGRIRRLRRLFYVEKNVIAGFNVVVHCRQPSWLELPPDGPV